VTVETNILTFTHFYRGLATIVKRPGRQAASEGSRSSFRVARADRTVFDFARHACHAVGGAIR